MFGIDSIPVGDVFFAAYAAVGILLIVAHASSPVRNWVMLFCSWVLGAAFGYAWRMAQQVGI